MNRLPWEFWIKENQDAANAAVEQSQDLDQCPELCHCCQGPRVHQLKMPSEIWLDCCSNSDLMAALVSHSSGPAIWYQPANGRAPHTVELGDKLTRLEKRIPTPARIVTSIHWARFDTPPRFGKPSSIMFHVSAVPQADCLAW